MSRPYNPTGIKADSAAEYFREYNRRLYTMRKENGLCVSCGKPAQKGITRCVSCARHYNRRYKLRTQNCKEKGLCIWCAKPAQEGRSFCSACQEKAKLRNAAHRAKKKAKKAEVGE